MILQRIIYFFYWVFSSLLIFDNNNNFQLKLHCITHFFYWVFSFYSVQFFKILCIQTSFDVILSLDISDPIESFLLYMLEMIFNEVFPYLLHFVLSMTCIAWIKCTILARTSPFLDSTLLEVLLSGSMSLLLQR